MKLAILPVFYHRLYTYGYTALVWPRPLTTAIFSVRSPAVMQDYPRPQLVRESYENLNGYWDMAITKTDARPDLWDGKILVPFSPEAELSGVNRTLAPGEFLWYRRTLSVSGLFAGKTRFGLRLRAVGEHPQAADTLGVNVSLVRYICVALSGFLAGLGGASITLATVSVYRPSIVIGQGFIAIAAVIFGKFKPHRSVKDSVV